MSEPLGADPVEQYLDELADASRLRGRRLRYALAEVEDHLAEARAAYRRAGLDEAEAGHRAVAEFGLPGEVAAGLDRAAAPSLTTLLRDGMRTLVLLGAVGLLAVGLSGLLAAAAGAAFGTAFVSGDAPDVTYSASRCADFQEYHPSRTCTLAAMRHHYDEVVGLREEAGALGVLVLAGWLAVVRPWRRSWRRPGSLPPAFAPTVAASLFGAAAAVLLPLGTLQLVVTGSGSGPGNPLSGGLVAAAAFAVCAGLLWRSLRTRPA